MQNYKVFLRPNHAIMRVHLLILIPAPSNHISHSKQPCLLSQAIETFNHFFPIRDHGLCFIPQEHARFYSYVQAFVYSVLRAFDARPLHVKSERSLWLLASLLYNNDGYIYLKADLYFVNL
jgi:hypothetical protein